jgi:hypothetical protein
MTGPLPFPKIALHKVQSYTHRDDKIKILMLPLSTLIILWFRSSSSSCLHLHPCLLITYIPHIFHSVMSFRRVSMQQMTKPISLPHFLQYAEYSFYLDYVILPFLMRSVQLISSLLQVLLIHFPKCLSVSTIQ